MGEDHFKMETLTVISVGLAFISVVVTVSIPVVAYVISQLNRRIDDVKCDGKEMIDALKADSKVMIDALKADTKQQVADEEKRRLEGINAIYSFITSQYSEIRSDLREIREDIKAWTK